MPQSPQYRYAQFDRPRRRVVAPQQLPVQPPFIPRNQATSHQQLFRMVGDLGPQETLRAVFVCFDTALHCAGQNDLRTALHHFAHDPSQMGPVIEFISYGPLADYWLRRALRSFAIALAPFSAAAHGLRYQPLVTGIAAPHDVAPHDIQNESRYHAVTALANLRDWMIGRWVVGYTNNVMAPQQPAFRRGSCPVATQLPAFLAAAVERRVPIRASRQDNHPRILDAGSHWQDLLVGGVEVTEDRLESVLLQTDNETLQWCIAGAGILDNWEDAGHGQFGLAAEVEATDDALVLSVPALDVEHVYDPEELAAMDSEEVYYIANPQDTVILFPAHRSWVTFATHAGIGVHSPGDQGPYTRDNTQAKELFNFEVYGETDGSREIAVMAYTVDSAWDRVALGALPWRGTGLPNAE